MESLRLDPTPPAEPYDELVTGQHAIRRHWQALVSVIRSLPGEGMRERAERAQQLLGDSGVSLNWGDRAGGPMGRWPFDLMPLVITSQEWRAIESGVAQRARLLGVVLDDLYGAQRMLAERRLPPALAHANPGFLRACRRAAGAVGPHPLTIFACDLVRGVDGAWSVLADHTQTPLGAGYALANRNTLSRVLPEAFRSIAVRQIRPFFDLWQSALSAQAPADNPLIGLLTPGSLSASYYEHALLARTLGVTLVEGGDLSVREGGLALKTIGGLKTVDVLLRRLGDAFCDPLELRADSMLGVPGLVEAARERRVIVANALGSGAAESPAWSPFLPGLAQALLGEELTLPALDAWWLGEPPALTYALEHLSEMVFRRCSGGDSRPIHAATLSVAERAALEAELRASPQSWIAQEPVRPSQAPCSREQGLEPEGVVLRVFALCPPDADPVVMAGGVAWTTPGDPLAEFGRLGRCAKDVWVLAEDPIDVFIPTTDRFQKVALVRGGDIQSRVADNLYWLGRYTERLDNASRLLRAAMARISVAPTGARELTELRCLGRALVEAELIDPQAALGPPGGAALAHALTGFAETAGPFDEALGQIRRLADAVRDRLSLDMSAAVDRMIGGLRERVAAAGADFDRLIAVLDDTIRFVATFSGLAQENVVRGAGWRFMDLGRRIERGLFTARGALSAFNQSPIAWEPAMALALELCDSTMTYRSRYLLSLQPAPVLDLVLLDESNPRSLAFQLHAIENQMRGLGRMNAAAPEFRPLDLLGDVQAAVKLFEGDERAWRHEGLALVTLRDALERSATGVVSGSEAITRAYFSLVPAPQRLGQGGD